MNIVNELLANKDEPPSIVTILSICTHFLVCEKKQVSNCQLITTILCWHFWHQMKTGRVDQKMCQTTSHPKCPQKLISEKSVPFLVEPLKHATKHVDRKRFNKMSETHQTGCTSINLESQAHSCTVFQQLAPSTEIIPTPSSRTHVTVSGHLRLSL